MKKLVRNSKGVAIELAILTMLVVFALSTILLVVAERIYSLNRRTLAIATDRIAVDDIGEDFYHAIRQNITFDAEGYTAYAVTTQDDGEQHTLYVRDLGSAETVLLVVVRGVGDSARVVRWAHDDATPQ